MTNCEVCTIISTKNNSQDAVIVENNCWRVTLDKNQRFLGKMLVTLLKHKASLNELDDQDWLEFGEITKNLDMRDAVMTRTYSQVLEATKDLELGSNRQLHPDTALEIMADWVDQVAHKNPRLFKKIMEERPLYV